MDIVEIYDSSYQTLYAGGYNKYVKDIETKSYKWRFKDFINSDGIKSLGGDNSLSSGLISTPDGMAMYAARPILKSDGSGPSIAIFFWTIPG